MPGKVHSDFLRGTEKDSGSVCEQGLLGRLILGARARRGGGTWAGPAIRRFHWDRVGREGRGANPQDLEARQGPHCLPL